MKWKPYFAFTEVMVTPVLALKVEGWVKGSNWLRKSGPLHLQWTAVPWHFDYFKNCTFCYDNIKKVLIKDW